MTDDTFSVGSQGKPLEAELLRLARSCYQCGRCSGGCSLAFAMDHTPRQILRLLQYGLVEEAVASNVPWYCATCHGCSLCCPRGVDITGLMYALRQLAVGRGVFNESAWFYREFVANMAKRGRIYEPELMLSYARRAGLGAVVPHLRMGAEMALQRKLLYRPRSIPGGTGLKMLVDEMRRSHEPAE